MNKSALTYSMSHLNFEFQSIEFIRWCHTFGLGAFKEAIQTCMLKMENNSSLTIHKHIRDSYRYDAESFFNLGILLRETQLSLCYSSEKEMNTHESLNEIKDLYIPRLEEDCKIRLYEYYHTKIFNILNDMKDMKLIEKEFTPQYRSLIHELEKKAMCDETKK